MNISREERPNSATHLLRRLCHHGDQLASFHPIGTCFTQTSIEPGVPKTDKHGALGTGSVLPSFSHTPGGGGEGHLAKHSSNLHPVACDPDRRERTLESQQGATIEVSQLVVPSALTWSAIIMAPYQPVTQHVSQRSAEES